MHTLPFDKAILEQLAGHPLTDQEVFDTGQNLVGFFELLLKADRRNHPERYKQKTPVEAPKGGDNNA